MSDKIKAIITDLDGTLLPKGGTISSKSLQSLQQAKKAGLVCIIATGRNLYAALQVLPSGLPIDYLVFSSGAGILRWKDRQIIFSKHLNQQETQSIASYLWDYNVNFTIQREIPANHYFYFTHLYPVHRDFQQRLETYAPFGTQIDSPEDIQGNVTHFVLILDARQLYLIQKIQAGLRTCSIVRSTSPIDYKATWLEIFPSGINKGNSCKNLLQQLQIIPQECAGLGNDYNDVDFLNICSQSYLVANAPVNLKGLYKLVKSDREDGFSEFIQKVI